MFPITIENGRKVMKIPAGVHRIAEPIAVTENGLRIVGEDGAVLRGTVSLGGLNWKDEGGGRFSARLPESCTGVPDALYVNGEKYRMARYPAYDPDCPILGGYAADCLSKERADGWADPAGAYLHAIHKHHWGGFSYRITGKDAQGNLTYEGGWQNNRQMGMHPEYRFLENLYEELKRPGEWHFAEKTRTVTLILKEGHDLATAEAAVNASFFRLEGVSGVTIGNLTFEKSARTFMLTKEPLLRSDWTIYRGGAVYFRDAADCTLSHCRFEDVGSNAIFVDGNCRGIAVERCHICGIGASGVCFVGRSDCVRSPLFEYGETHSLDEIDLTPGPKSDNYPKNCRVSDCLITEVGLTEKQATGVEISMSYGITVENCTICGTSRAGLNISEGTFGGHRILGCDVFDTVRETGDHGSFNSWGRDRFWHLRGLADEDAHRYADLDRLGITEIAYCRFRCDRGWDIDLDDGSGGYNIHHNLCLAGGIKLREGFSRHVHHNITVNNSLHFHVWYPDSGDVIEENLLFTPYRPIGMPEGKWGERIDGNYLYDSTCPEPHPAEELSSVSGQDGRSVCLSCEFAAPEEGNYRLLSPDLPGLRDFPTEFGVRNPELKALARTPVLPEFHRAAEEEEERVLTLHGMRVKNIDTDDLMSAYGTAGKRGVLVLAVSETAEKKGLRPDDVILACGGTPIGGTDDFAACFGVYQDPITVLRGQKETLLK